MPRPIGGEPAKTWMTYIEGLEARVAEPETELTKWKELCLEACSLRDDLQVEVVRLKEQIASQAKRRIVRIIQAE